MSDSASLRKDTFELAKVEAWMVKQFCLNFERRYLRHLATVDQHLTLERQDFEKQGDATGRAG